MIESTTQIHNWVGEHWIVIPFLPVAWRGLKFGLELYQKWGQDKRANSAENREELKDAREVIRMALTEYKDLLQHYKDGLIEANRKIEDLQKIVDEVPMFRAEIARLTASNAKLQEKVEALEDVMECKTLEGVESDGSSDSDTDA